MLHYLFPVQVYLTKIETEKKSFSLKRLSESLCLVGRQEFSRRVGRDPKDTISNTIKESYTHSYYCQIVVNFKVKACVRYFYQIFIFSPIDSPAKTMKNTFYFIKKALFVLEIIKFLYFHPSLFFFHCFRR